MRGPELDGHPPCNLRCAGDVHCDVSHWHDNGWTEGEVCRKWGDHGVRVVRIEPATEYPPRNGGAQAHLVYWEDR